jgi:3-methyladenine DNA glycosylase AlkD
MASVSNRVGTRSATTACREIEARLREFDNPARAQGTKAYLKSNLDFFGATVWQIRSVLKEFAAKHPDLTHEQLVDIAARLWAKPNHELRMAAVMLLDSRPDLLGPRDLGFIEQLIRESFTWAYVDALAGDVAGAILVDHPDAASRMDRWARDPDFWLRRSALLALMLPMKRGAGFNQFAGYADAMLDEKEFFIRKAIGWVLREVSKRRPDEVYRWLQPRAKRASGVTMREAVKYLSAEQREKILDAR